MSDQLQLRRDTQANVAAATPAAGELALDTTRNALLIGDGATPGGLYPALVTLCAGYVAGRYYIASTGAGGTTGLALTANTLYTVPFPVMQKQTFTKIGINITAAAGTNGRLGVYALAPGMLGGSLILDAGAVSISTTGLKEVTGLNFTLNPGLYGLSFLPDTGVTVSEGQAINVCHDLLGLGSSAPGIVLETYVSQAQSYGALPASLSTSPTYLTGSPPGVWLRL